MDWLDKEALAAVDRLAGSELQSLLLEAMRRRAAVRDPADVLAQYRRDAFCRPATIDQRTFVAIDGHLLAAADAFTALELSPVTPLGTCSTVALVDQNRVLSALRGTEIVSDPTNVLALECASRLRETPGAELHFATCQRVIRTQPVPKLPGYAQHFRIFVLASAGRERADHGFAVDTLALHIRTILRALDRLEQHGYRFGARRVEIKTTEAGAPIGDRLATALGDLAIASPGSAGARSNAQRCGVAIARKPLDHPYYAGVRYNIWVTAPDGNELPLIDGGLCDWVAKLMSNRRYVFAVTGMGAQLVPIVFRAE